MQKKTEVRSYGSGFTIGINDNISSLGSCFSDEISKYLMECSVEIQSNPFGTVYNCHSIYRTMQIIFGGNKFTEDDLINESGKFISLDHTTMFDSADSGEALDKINRCIEKYKHPLKKTGVFILTPGTSVVYHYRKNGRLAANCHKLSGELFEKRMMQADETTAILNQTIALIKENNPGARIIFTLSPIRHTPNDPVENNLSKSILRTAIGNVVNNDDIVYFPSYEIVLDELRNYSFYRNDGVHLKKKTVDIIADRFVNVFFEKDYLSYISEFRRCLKFLTHKPHDRFSEEYNVMLKKNIMKLIILYNLKDSPIIEKYIIISVKRIIRRGGYIQESDLQTLPEGKFVKFLTLMMNMAGDKTVSMDSKDFDYENDHYGKLAGLKRKILASYYHNKGEYELSSKLLN